MVRIGADFNRHRLLQIRNNHFHFFLNQVFRDFVAEPLIEIFRACLREWARLTQPLKF